jgi:hypothetical protein
MQKHPRSGCPGTKSLFVWLGLAAASMSAACGALEVRDLKDTFGNKKKGSSESDQDWSTVRVGVTPSQLLTTRLVGADYSPDNFSLFSLDSVAAFDLVNAAAFKFKVTGCASGYSITTTSVASTSTTMKLYKTDKNCEVGLVEFTYDSKVYSPLSVSELKGAAGTAATFSAGAGDDLKVKVYKQLIAAGVADGQEAAFTFIKSTKGSDANVVDYTAGSPLSVNGIEAPSFSILSPNGIELQDIAAADGKGKFKFTLQCAETLTQPGGGSNWACPRVNGETNPQLITNMSVKLIHDTADKSTYSYDEIDTIMASGTTPITNSMRVSGTNIQIENLWGPGKLVDFKQMVLIIGYTDPSTPTSRGTSYKYFNVDIGAPVP